jgi:Fic family protein
MNNINWPENLKVLQKLSNKTQQELANVFDVTFLSFNNWINGKSIPRIKKQVEIQKELEKYGVFINLERNKNTSNLENIILNLQNKHKNILKEITERPDLIKEFTLLIAYNSNAIEGSTMTLEDTKNVILHKINVKNKTLIEQLEAKNHDMAFNYVLEKSLEISKGKEKISEEIILKIHKILMAGILINAGEYRKHNVRIVGSYVPTANFLKIPNLIMGLLEENFTNFNIDKISKFHADFEKIHPFSDGNGRTGRLLMVLMLLVNNFPPVIIKNKEKQDYYKYLQQAQLNEDFENLSKLIKNLIIEGYGFFN